MKFDNNQYVIYRHNDRDHDHVHIVASRIRLDGTLVHDGWDYKRSEAVLRKLEREFNLEPVQFSSEKLKRTASTGQFRRLEREQLQFEQGLRPTLPEIPVKEKLQTAIERASVDHPTMPQFIENLLKQNIEVQHGFTRNGKSKGISYKMDSIHFSGTQLGAAYTFPGLQKHLRVSYSPLRDNKRIQQLVNSFGSTQSDTTEKNHKKLFEENRRVEGRRIITERNSNSSQELDLALTISVQQQELLERNSNNELSEQERSIELTSEKLNKQYGNRSRQHLKEQELLRQLQEISNRQRKLDEEAAIAAELKRNSEQEEKITPALLDELTPLPKPEQQTSEQNQTDKLSAQELSENIEQFRPQPHQIDSIQRQRAEFIRQTAGRFLKARLENDSTIEVKPGIFVIEGKNYRLTYEKQILTSTIDALDGRGNLITAKQGQLQSAQNISDKDVDRWTSIKEQLDRDDYFKNIYSQYSQTYDTDVKCVEALLKERYDEKTIKEIVDHSPDIKQLSREDRDSHVNALIKQVKRNKNRGLSL
ncbi:MAG: hypothetical protein NVS2B14_14020 [Chamaesiphon sp.]